MDAKFQPSFIPKQSVMSTPQVISSRISLLSVIAVVIFIVTIGLVAAVFITKYVLKGDITTLNQNLVDA
ncbi:MAG TPA: hypothetical protein VJZ94_02745, partial [Candidatus Paceibacterota bacterium]|nr:hypothetical protein [Candidatus Paceibacterota bacterium]